MFSDEILEKILNRPEVRAIPCGYQSDMIQAIAEVLEESEVTTDATLRESEFF